MKKINFKKLILVLGIIIVLNLFFNYGVATFYKTPKFEDFCKPEALSEKYETKERCESVGGLWMASQSVYPAEKIAPVPVTNIITTDQPTAWCDVQYTCGKDYQDAMAVYNRNVFIILVIAGVISIIAGFMTGQSEAVSLGLSFGGILSLIIGTIRYWSAMDDYLRFIILGVALAVLIWIGIKKFRDQHESIQS